jgi:hypothetical protein
MRRSRTMWAALPLIGLLSGCQSPTSSDDPLDVDDFVDATVTPAHATAAPSTDGRTYRVARGNNQPDDVLAYDWVTTFAITLAVNDNATHKDVDLEFPVTITAATGKVQQATGGIVSPPTGGDTEHYESVLIQSSGSTIAAVNGTVTLTFQVWYDLPSLKREALITETINFKDADGVTFAKTVDIVVDP